MTLISQPPQNVNPSESSVKHALDHAEFVEHVPELQRSAMVINVGDRGEPILVLSHLRHPSVKALINELHQSNVGRDNDLRDGRTFTVDLKTARQHFTAARRRYDKRVQHRLLSNSMTHADARYVELGRYSSLSAILIDRAEAAFWRKIVKELEYFQRVQQSNNRAKLKPGVVIHRMKQVYHG
jgi:hypothetical protein